MNDEILDLNKNENSSVKKPKIVPSYMKKNTSENKKVKTKEKKHKHIKSKITLVILLILALALVLGIYKLFNFIRFISYSDYEKKMDTYGFSSLYNNGKATSSDTVTKAEAIKIIIAATLNKNDISDFVNSETNSEGSYQGENIEANSNDYFIENSSGEEDTSDEIYNTDEEVNNTNKYTEKYTDSAWIDYAVARKIITNDDINKDNKDGKASYIDVLTYISNSKNNILKEKLDTSLTPSFKDYSSYNLGQQSALADLAVNSIIENTNKNLNGNRKIYKGELNKLIVTYIQKYNTITIKGAKININKDKEPSNVSNYPYTLSNVDKSIYEKQDYIKDQSKYKNATELYSSIKDEYSQIDEIISTYFNTILNINYADITDEKVSEIKDTLSIITPYNFNMEELDKYIEYVKSNKISLTGTASVEMPAVYFDGEYYRARTKIEFTVQNATDLSNLIFKDMRITDVQKYTKNKTEMVIDVPVTSIKNNGVYYVVAQPIYNLVAGQVK